MTVLTDDLQMTKSHERLLHFRLWDARILKDHSGSISACHEGLLLADNSLP